MIPAPDAEFVRGALEAVGVEDPRRAGLEDCGKRWEGRCGRTWSTSKLR